MGYDLTPNKSSPWQSSLSIFIIIKIELFLVVGLKFIDVFVFLELTGGIINWLRFLDLLYSDFLFAPRSVFFVPIIKLGLLINIRNGSRIFHFYIASVRSVHQLLVLSSFNSHLTSVVRISVSSFGNLTHKLSLLFLPNFFGNLLIGEISRNYS